MTKKFLSTALLALTCMGSLTAQENTPPSHWTLKSVSGINLSQTSLTNWAAGGENSVAWNVYFNGSANYKKEKWSWDNGLVADFGKTYTSTEKWQKSLDKINLNSKIGYALNKHWNLSVLADFLTQFTTGYKTISDQRNGLPYISNFMAPGYLTLATGADYKPSNNFSLLLAPVTGKVTFVTDPNLSAIGAYGVKKGEKILAELGFSAVANYNQKLGSNINLISKLTLFSAYNHNFGNIDVMWDVMLACKINKFMSANLTTNLVYDDDVRSAEGGPKIQLREVFGIGLTYTMP